jgi:integrase
MARARRGRGEGGVRQRADGLWEGSVSLGVDGAGKRIRKSVYGRTKAEALEAMRSLREQTPGAVDAATLTVGGFLRTWLDGLRPSVEVTTWEQYDGHARNHIGPHLGGVRLASLTGLHVSQLYAKLLKAGTSAATTKKVGVTLTSALKSAVRLRLIPHNPAADVPRPKSQRKAPTVYSPEQVGAFFRAASSDRLYALYVLAVDSGCRLGELLALRWTDYDDAGGTIAVVRSMAERGGKRWEKETKTRRGRRTVRLGLSLGAVRGHRERMQAEGQDTAAGLVFCQTTGGPLRQSNVRSRSFLPILRRAAIPTIRFHDLRHSCASLLLLAGIDVKVISERLGHGSTAFTADVYQHLLPGLQEAAAERLHDLFPAVGG